MIRTINQDLAERVAEHEARKVLRTEAAVNVVVAVLSVVATVLLVVHTMLRAS